MKKNKRILLLLGIFSAIFFVSLTTYKFLVPKGICESIELFLCDIYLIKIVRFADFFGFVVFFSFALFFMKDVFQQAWLRFAVWGGPLTLFIFTLVNKGFFHTDGGLFNMDAEKDTVITALAYTFFIIGSAIQLLRVYLKERKQKSL